MIFSIRRASNTLTSIAGGPPLPCPQAKEVLPKNDENDGLYTIEIKSLKELMEFVNREEKIVLYKNGKHHYFSLDTLYEESIENMPDGLIMIYDDYLE